MARIKVKENQLRGAIRSWPEHEDGKISFIEPGLGSDTGIADCLFIVGAHWVPVELKRGPSVVKELRPSQRAWHRASLHHGAQTFGLSLRNDGSVIMVALGLAGGLMSELIETQMMSWQNMGQLDYSQVIQLINAYYS